MSTWRTATRATAKRPAPRPPHPLSSPSLAKKCCWRRVRWPSVVPRAFMARRVLWPSLLLRRARLRGP
eukprot:9082033-Lingulodinium_polyedra.AAC.1